MGAFIGRWAALARGQLHVPGGCIAAVAHQQRPAPPPRWAAGQPLSGVRRHRGAAMPWVLTHTFRTEDDGVPGTVRLTLYLQVTPTTRCTWTGWPGGRRRHRVQTPQATPSSTWPVRAAPWATRCRCPPAGMCRWPLMPHAGRTGAGHAIGLFASCAACFITPMPRVTGRWVVTTCAGRRLPGLCCPSATPVYAWPRSWADPASGRAMQVWSTAPGVQVYAGHGLRRPGPRPGPWARAGHLAVAAWRRHLPGPWGTP